MTDRLDEIQARVSTLHYAIDEGHSFAAASFASTVCGEDVPFLLAEVTRLRAIIEEAALAIEAAGNTAYKTTHWQEAPGYMEAARILRRKATPEGGTK